MAYNNARIRVNKDQLFQQAQQNQHSQQGQCRNFYSQQEIKTNYSKQIDDYQYSANDMIGQGQFSKVFSGNHVRTNERVAIKVVEVSSLQKPIFNTLLNNEITILKSLSNKNLLALKQVFQTKNNIYLVSEYCNEGDLAEILKRKKLISEPQAILIFKHLLNGLKALQRQDIEIIHRDIKPANILIQDSIPKLADFGFAISQQLSNTQRDTLEGFHVGTPLYMSPETLLHNKYTYKTDIWALGIVFYEMLFEGNVPFFSVHHEELFEKIKNYQTSRKLPFPKDSKVSQQARQLLISLLEFDPKKRISVDELIKHPLLNEQECQIENKIVQRKKQLYAVNCKVTRYTSPFGKRRPSDSLKNINDLDLTCINEKSDTVYLNQTQCANVMSGSNGSLKTHSHTPSLMKDQKNVTSRINLKHSKTQQGDTSTRETSELTPSTQQMVSYQYNKYFSLSRITRIGFKINPRTLIFDQTVTIFCDFLDQVLLIIQEGTFFSFFEEYMEGQQDKETNQLYKLKEKVFFLFAKTQTILYNKYGVVKDKLAEYNISYQTQFTSFPQQGLQDPTFKSTFDLQLEYKLDPITNFLLYLKLFIECFAKYIELIVEQSPDELAYVLSYYLQQLKDIQQSIIRIDYAIITYQCLDLLIENFNNFFIFGKILGQEALSNIKPQQNIGKNHWISLKQKLNLLNLE